MIRDIEREGYEISIMPLVLAHVLALVLALVLVRFPIVKYP